MRLQKLVIFVCGLVMASSVFVVSAGAEFNAADRMYLTNASTYAQSAADVAIQNRTKLNEISNSLSSNLSTIITSLSSINTDTTNLYDTLVNLNNTVNTISSTLSTISTNLSLTLAHVLVIDSNVSKLTDFFVPPEDVELKEASEDSVETVTSMYSSDVGGTTTAQKMGSLGDFSTGISDSLNTGVSAGQLFDVFSTGSDGDGGSVFGFFSRQAMADMDSSLDISRARLKSAGTVDHSQDVVTHYFDYNNSVLDSILGGDGE